MSPFVFTLMETNGMVWSLTVTTQDKINKQTKKIIFLMFDTVSATTFIRVSGSSYNTYTYVDNNKISFDKNYEKGENQ